MAVESPGFANQNSTYSAEILRRALFADYARGASVGSVVGGLIASGDLALSAPVSGMTVNVAAGEILVPGSSSATQGGYYCRVSSTTSLVIAASDPSNPRVDRVVAQVTDSAYSGVTNTWALAVVTGTPTAGATLANLNGVGAAPASSLTLGYVLVPAASTNVTNGNISNTATPAQPGLSAAQWYSGLDGAKGTASAYKGAFYYATDSNALYFSDGTTWRTVYGSRGAANISASQSTSSASYTTLTTQDQVTNIVLPTNGLIAVSYQALWQESVNQQARAAIFLGANQLVAVQRFTAGGGGPFVSETGISPTSSAGINQSLASCGIGLMSSGFNTAYGPDVTTGQAVGMQEGNTIVHSATETLYGGGPCYIFAAAGTYTVSVQFRAISGSVTASNRKLWVQAIPFG